MSRLKYLIFVFALVLPVIAYGGETPLNPEFVEWRKALKEAKVKVEAKAAKTATPKGLIRKLMERPSPVNRKHLKGKSILPKKAPKPMKTELGGVIVEGSTAEMVTLDTVTVPTEPTFDLRDSNQVSPIRDQGSYGTCWAFAALASLESNASIQGWRPTPDYSEKHLAYYAYTDIDSFLVGYDHYDPSESVYDLGGNNDMSAAMLTRWTGAVAEAVEPYTDMGPSGTIPAADAPNAAWLSSVLHAPGGTEVVGNIKYLVKEYGALRISMYWSSSYYNSSTYGFYNDSTTSSNHAVDIIGWDDNYPAANFPTSPTANGAWIVRNSWGTSWGDGGYFYISYEDQTVVDRGAYAYLHTLVRKDVVQYHHTPLGLTSTYYVEDSTLYTANIFESTGDQEIQHVGIITLDVNDVVTVSVYTDVTASNPTSGTLAYQSSPIAYASPGSRTIKLPTPIAIVPGQKFSVVVRTDTTESQVYIPCEKPIPRYSSKATASSGQSFYSYSGTSWTDWTTVANQTNIDIRAYAAPPLPDDLSFPARNLLLLD